MDFDFSPRTKELQAQLQRFMDEHIYPNEARYEAEIEANTKAGKRWTPLQLIEELKPKARAQGLWNLFLPPTAGGKGSKASGREFGLSNGDYAPLAEIMGRLPWAAEVFNCQAPDVPNMIMLQHAATPDQKERLQNTVGKDIETKKEKLKQLQDMYRKMYSKDYDPSKE